MQLWLVTGISVIVVVGVVGLVLLVRQVGRSGREQLRKEAASWQTLAEELGGTIESATGPWYRRTSERLVVELEGQRLALDIFVQSTGQSSITYTRVQAELPVAHRLQVSQEHVFAKLGKLLGGQDLEIGDLEYDEAYVIRGDDPDWVGRVLTPEVRDLHRAAPDALLHLHKGTMIVQRLGRITDLAELRALLGLAAAVATAIRGA
jgi:hypothetical protein